MMNAPTGTVRPRPAAALLAALVLGTLAPVAPQAHAQPGDTYRPGRKSEPAQKAPRPTQRPDQRPDQRRELEEEGRELFKGPGGPSGNSESASNWSIVLFAFRGETRAADAQRALAMVQGEWGLPDAYLDQRGQSVVVVIGRYHDPESPEAQADLQRVRGVEALIGGEPQRPFEFAFLAPPANIPGNQPEYDLRNAQKLHGRWAMYTLQIGIYRREDGTSSAAEIADFRRLAEEAVLTLRREGEQAFYYHGPSGSTVTLGLFGVEDFDPQLRLESPRLRTLRARYPNNLLNGAGIKRRMTVTSQEGRQVRTERLDPSLLVAVPKMERK